LPAGCRYGGETEYHFLRRGSREAFRLDDSTSPASVTWITDTIAITNFVSAHDKDVLAEHHIKGVLCLDRDLEGCPSTARGVDYVRVVHLNDGANELFFFREAVAALEEMVAGSGRVIVHCRAGRSRSIAVVAAYLKRALNIEANDALEIVRSKRQSAVAPELIRLVERFEL
jgi:atypical dual specificity phosphatase